MTATLLRNTLTSLHEHAREFAAVLQEELQHLSRLPTPGDWSLQDRKLVVMRELENGHRQLQQALQANGLGFLQGAALHRAWPAASDRTVCVCGRTPCNCWLTASAATRSSGPAWRVNKPSCASRSTCCSAAPIRP